MKLKNLFSYRTLTTASNAIQKSVNPVSYQESVQTAIAEIHNSFDTASERLLKEAQEIISAPVDENALLRYQLGFTETKGAKEAANAGEKKQEQRELLETVLYYQTQYPKYKFITENQVIDICTKYGLLFGSTERYIGDIPVKNLLEIKEFKDNKGYIKPDDLNRIDYHGRSYFPTDINNLPNIESYSYVQDSLMICAPANEMKIYEHDRVVSGYKIVPDPIVLCPIKKGYLIISKWGLEGEDKSLVNEVNN